jgi:hypothetical protein
MKVEPVVRRDNIRCGTNEPCTGVKAKLVDVPDNCELALFCAALLSNCVRSLLDLDILADNYQADQQRGP